MELESLFENNFDCYADTCLTDENGNLTEGVVIQAMTKNKFIEVVTELLQGVHSTTTTI